MPRQARLDVPGALHYIMVRGIKCKKARISPLEVMNDVHRRAVRYLRAAIASRCRTELGLSSAKMARHLGVAASSISRLIEKREIK